MHDSISISKAWEKVLEGFDKRLIGLGRTESTRNSYLRVARWFARYAASRQIDQQLVDGFENDVTSKVGQNTRRAYAQGLNAFLEYLGADCRLEPPKRIRSEARSLKLEDFHRLVEAVRVKKNRYVSSRDAAVLLMLGEGAARAGEVREMRLSDLNLEKGFIIVRRPKGKHDRKIFFGKATEEALIDYLKVRGEAREPESRDHLFLSTKRGRLRGLTPIAAIVRSATAMAGLESNVHPHMLRHMRITQLSREGLTPYQLRLFAGHSDLRTTLGYVHIQDDEVIEALSSLDHPARAPMDTARSDIEWIRISLATRLARGEIGEEIYRLALESLEDR